MREAIRARARELGFLRVGVTSADPLSPAQQARWRRWRARSVAGDMHYLARPTPRRTHPRDLLPEARSAVVVSAAYYQGDPPPDASGKVARYAWGRDYHCVLRGRLEHLAKWIARTWAPRLTWRACVDSAPLDERALAWRAGLGWFGKNGLLIDPEAGSWILLGVLLLSLPLPPDQPLRGPRFTCGPCRRCIEACPTGAIVAPYRLDPSRCISYLTIEHKGALPNSLAERMDGWAFGCDVCQQVCPFNHAPARRTIPELASTEGVGSHISLETLKAAGSNKNFLRKWGHTPLERPGRKRLERNLRALGQRDRVAREKPGPTA